MIIPTIYADATGKSHFGEIDFPLADAGPIGFLSQAQPATGIIFRETAGDYDYDWHRAPQRQFVIILEGGVDFTVGDGTTRRFGAGDVILLEDTTGQGHRSRAVAGAPRRSIFVTLP